MLETDGTGGGPSPFWSRVQGAAATLVDNATRSPKRAKDFIVDTFFC
jgi:hypothetical protein